MDTVTIPKDEYECLELIAKDELSMSIKRGLDDAANGRVRER